MRRSARYLRNRLGPVLSLAALAAASAVALVATGLLGGPAATAPAAGESSGGEPAAQTDASLPAANVTMIGSSPQEAPGETWGLGEQQGGTGASPVVLVRYTQEGGWQLAPGLQGAAGEPLSGFELDKPSGLLAPSPLAGSITPAGSGVLIGTVQGNEGVTCGSAHTEQVVLVRDPGGPFKETAPLGSGEAALGSGECLFGRTRAPLVAALEEGSGRAGALVVPVSESGGVEDGVLHWDGTSWTREPILLPSPSSTDFRVLAIGASSPSNAWLLAQLSSSGPYPAGAVALFRRETPSGKTPSWQPVSLSPGSGDEEAHPLSADGEPFTVHGTGEPPSVQAQVLTVSEQGVWVDGERQDAHTSTTLFFKPEGDAGGTIEAAWCTLPANVPAGTPPCDHELPEPLPSGPSRSFAWADASTQYGQRVISGFREGVTLRLDGPLFTRVLGLGGGPGREPGATYGSGFSSPTEGWLGEGELPVHLTTSPAPSRLTPWPVSFRHALLAVAPQPGAPVGALSSEALAVGDRGEVARYIPGSGWLPETLPGPSGRIEHPRLRAVAWPTPSRAYAVGDNGAMWLWRAETGVWEPDPADVEVTGNLMGVAFDPNDPSRGYAVGTGGLLLGYGKTWTQEPLPAQAQGASFTSIAFAGSEAIVAYRKLLDPSRRSSYVGGLLTNEGSGWQVDEGAAAALGSPSKVPEVVAAMPDGGAAFVAESYGPGETGAQLFVRQGPGAPWTPAPTPLPHGSAPGSLALFRESGNVRAIVAGSAPDGFEVESGEATPPGTPQPILKPYPLPNEEGVGLVRETAAGWSDEQHELNDVAEPAGKYTSFDTVYQPDPIRALLLGPDGSQGWALGGDVDNEQATLDTADVERYPAEATPPPGEGTSPITTETGQATFTVGGNAQCAAPCADRANARIGPDVWLSAALVRASQIGGVRAFLYTGSRVTTGETSGPPTLAVPYAREFARYAQLLGASPLTAYAANSPTDLDGARSECTFDAEFGGFPGAYSPESSSPEGCGGQSGYYELNSSGPGGAMNVIVLDDSADVGQTQLEWLIARLRAAEGAHLPVIVVGNADLGAQIAAGDQQALAVASALIAHGASAYFYDSPEENVQKPLQVGAASIPSFGSGTLGYVNFVAESTGEFIGESGFLLAQVDVAAVHEPPRGWAPCSSSGFSCNRVPVTAHLIPNIGELALEAKGGTLLRRSSVALFAALARRPRAGNRSPGGGAISPDTDPYIQIPSYCSGTRCAEGIFPEYTFTSSEPKVGNFVESEPGSSPESSTIPLLENEEPVPDPRSGLFCAFRQGTTTVTVTAGGLSSSLNVTVEPGSVRRPCGTSPIAEAAASAQTAAPAPPAPAPAASPAAAAPAPLIPPIPPVPAAPPPPAAAVPHPPAPLTAFIAPVPATALLTPIVPPVPTPARPTPPSGTSAVSSQVEAAEEEEEEEEATESVSNQAVAYRADEHEPWPEFILGIVVLAAFAGASIRRSRPVRGRRAQVPAHAAVSARSVQQSYERRSRRW